MASNKKTNTTTALFAALNLLFFSLVSAHGTGTGLIPKPPRPPKPPIPTPGETCPINALQLAVCANLLSGLLGITIGIPPTQPCCSLIQGLLDLEAAVCLCLAIRANVLGIVNLNVNLALSLLLNVCGKQVPRGFQCPST